MFDTIIKNGSVIDGSTAAAYEADIGICEGRIAAIGQLSGAQAKTVINAVGKAVTPGFIDIHRHGDFAAFGPDYGLLELSQGLTTVVNGNCGLSAAPISPKHREEILSYLAPITGNAPKAIPLDTMGHYLDALSRQKLRMHVGMLVGAGTVRADVAGYRVSHLMPEHYTAIHQRLTQALEDGALGVSLGLGYAPECFYSTQELIQALAPLSGTNIPITVHMREEGTAVDQAVREMLTVAKALRCPVHISHLKAIGKENWGKKIPQVLTLLAEAASQGLDVSWDVYPYTAGSTQLLHIMPPQLLTGGTEEICRKLQTPAARERLRQQLETGTDFDNISRLVGWDNILLTSFQQPENQQYLGKTVAQAAQMRGQAPADFVFDLLAQEHCAVTMIDFIASEEDIGAILQSDRVNIISDSTYPSTGNPHPRVYGTFARMIERYVCQKKVLTLPQAIHKMTAQPAKVLHLRKKGRIAIGYDADINIFRPEEVHELATYESPAQPSAGMHTVLVGGQAVIHQGQFTGAAPGRVWKGR